MDNLKQELNTIGKQIVYFCEECGKVVNINSNPERLYFCSCGKSGDYINCTTLFFSEYMYEIMKILANEHGDIEDGIG